MRAWDDLVRQKEEAVSCEAVRGKPSADRETWVLEVEGLAIIGQCREKAAFHGNHASDLNGPH